MVFAKSAAGALGRRFCFVPVLLMPRAFVSVTFLAYSLSQCVPLSMSRRFRRQAKMSSLFHRIARAVAIAAMLALASQAFAQSDDVDPEMRISSLKISCGNSPARTRSCNTATGSSKSACRRCRAVRKPPPADQPAVAQPSVAAAASGAAESAAPASHQPQPGYPSQQIAAPAPIVQEPAGAPPAGPPPRRRLRSQPESRTPPARRARSAAVSCRCRPKAPDRRSRRTRRRRAARSRQHRRRGQSGGAAAAAAAAQRPAPAR